MRRTAGALMSGARGARPNLPRRGRAEGLHSPCEEAAVEHEGGVRDSVPVACADPLRGLREALGAEGADVERLEPAREPHAVTERRAERVGEGVGGGELRHDHVQRPNPCGVQTEPLNGRGAYHRGSRRPRACRKLVRSSMDAAQVRSSAPSVVPASAALMNRDRFLVLLGTDPSVWARRYDIEPFREPCYVCGTELTTSVPFAFETLRGLLAPTCVCGNADTPYCVVRDPRFGDLFTGEAARSPRPRGVKRRMEPGPPRPLRAGSSDE